MAICCWFNTDKKYAYQVGRYCSSWEVNRVIVKICMVCGNKTIEKPRISSSEYESYLCKTEREVLTISRVNGISLLSEME